MTSTEEQVETMAQSTKEEEEMEQVETMAPYTKEEEDMEEVETMAPSTKEEKEMEEVETMAPCTKEEKEMEEVETMAPSTKEEEEDEEMEEVKEIVEKMPLPKQQKEAGVLNLNNEVVKMRKEVKRVRVMVIRKMTRQISALKKKKGKETDVERNQRRAARLQEEIHEMKALKPDLVTKTAVQENLSFEMVCKNPSSTISDRALARIATYPQFSKKIDAIKAAVKAFQEERMKLGIQVEKKKKRRRKNKRPEKMTAQLIDGDGEGDRKDDVEEEAKAVKQNEDGDEVGDGILKESDNATFDTTSEMDREKATADVSSEMDREKATADASSEMDREKAAPTDKTADIQNKDMSETQASFKANAGAKSIKTASIKNTETQNLVKNTPQSSNAENKPNPKPAPAKLQRKGEMGESDDEEKESDDEGEKEYFDDSTEERFYKQSSQSEDSDGDDNFFLGKVSKFKKKKSNSAQTVEEEKKLSELKSDQADPLKTTNKGQSELDELESRLNSKAAKLQTVFCSSLSGSKPSGGGQSRGGRGGGQYRGRGGQRGGGPDRFSKEPSRFHKQSRGTEGNPGFNNDNKHYYKDKGPESEDKGVGFAGRGRGRGRGDMARQQNSRGVGALAHQAPEQALHPSWEASKRRKEQQAQIMTFQGKKIKFDDDDWS